jgi:uncharacterized protein (UPF0303 family)
VLSSINEINDPTGNFIIIDAKLQGNRVTLVAVYGSNRDDPTFYQSLQSKIEMIGNTSVIIGVIGMCHLIMKLTPRIM